MAGDLFTLRRLLEQLIGLEPDFLGLCERNGRIIEDLASGGNLLNQRQCLDLSSKLSHTTRNVRELVSGCGGSADLFRPALRILYRYLEKAKLLVSKCGEEQWWVAAVFQGGNESAFREILLEVSLCYNAIYEQAESASEEWNALPDDLRQPSGSVFVPAMASDVQEDQHDLEKRLEELANDPSSVKLRGHPLPEDVAVKAQCLARYLLVKMDFASEQSLATSLDTCSEILWQKESEPAGTWGNSHYLGVGATDGGVCSKEWLGIPCAKKEFHVKEYESIFFKEAGILAHLKHPCVINFVCCSNGEARGDRFIAMEVMEKSLLDLIEDQKDELFPLPVAVDIIVQIARGMLHLHDQGVAHRDLKPQNVVVNRLTYSDDIDDHFCVKLVDFGTSKTKVEVSMSDTMTGRGIGTTMYRAPEIHPSATPSRRGRAMKGRAVRFIADVFSFAMTCAHILSLKVPFKEIGVNFSSDELYNGLMNGRRPSVPENCLDELVLLLKDCWNTIPRRRPTFIDICTRLETYRYKVLRGLVGKNLELGRGLDFIQMKMKEESRLQKVLFDSSNLEVEDENNKNDFVAIIPCTCGSALELLPQVPSSYTNCICDICGEDCEKCDGEIYHCESCHFETHPDCARIKHKVIVFFHHHPLHLLVRNYYKDNSDAMCRFCDESVEDCEWVYRCEKCNFDVRALCTKYPMEYWKWTEDHPHLLSLKLCLPRENILCTHCNGKIREYTWYYTCMLKLCAFDLHPLCSILPWHPLCSFDISHRFFLVMEQKSFYCGNCNAAGFSWFYHCNHCDVDIHSDCIYQIDEEEGNWNGTYEKFMIENGTKDDHTKMSMISELLDKLLITYTFEASSPSSLKPPPVIAGVQPSIQRLTLTERHDLDASNDINLQRKIAAKTIERIKAKKVATKERRLKLRINLLEMLKNLEKIVMDLRGSENMSQDEVLASTYEKLKKKHYLVRGQIAMQVQSKMNQAPQIGVFFQYRKQDTKYIRKVLTNLQVDMKEVYFALLCEELGHEHIVYDTARVFTKVLGEEKVEKLQPLLMSGLHVVTRAMNTLETQLTSLESVTIPCLEEWMPWDLRAIDLKKHSNQFVNLFEDQENVEALEQAEDSATEWFRSWLEDGRVNILKNMGLQRVRYKITEEYDFLQYKRGTLAWLCTEHLNSGLKDGMLKSYPLKYHNVEDDYQLRCSHVSLEE